MRKKRGSHPQRGSEQYERQVHAMGRAYTCGRKRWKSVSRGDNMEHKIGDMYKMFINFTEYTMVLTEIVEDPKHPECKYKLDFSPEYKKKKIKVPGLQVVRTKEEMDRLERA
jgi:hypothetical protein